MTNAPQSNSERPKKPASSVNGHRSFARPTRDAVTTIREDGSHRYLHPADVRGLFTRARVLSGWFLIALYLSLPWIKVGAHPAVFLDVASRRFHLFGLTLAFQDIWLLFFAITGLGFGLFFITSLLGRVWCGWACPQTVFLDHVYRRIERLMEGDATARTALDAAPWSAKKVLRRGGKHVLYVIASAVISHLFLAYFVSIPELWAMMRSALDGVRFHHDLHSGSLRQLRLVSRTALPDHLSVRPAPIRTHRRSLARDRLRRDPR
jgi:hypothetical protein